MAYQPRHSIIGVEIDGCEFTTDTQLMPLAPRTTPDGIEMHQRCLVHGVKINGVWFDACAMGDDFIEEMEYEIECMPLNAEGDIDEAALRMDKAEMEKRAAALSQPAPATEPAPHAMQLLTAALKADPDYAWSWHCNLAMPIMDATGVTCRVANEAGARLMRHLFDIDITKHPHYQVAPDQPAQPAPAQAVPLSDEMMRQARAECDADMVKRGIFVSGWIGAERAHGITGDQHG